MKEGHRVDERAEWRSFDEDKSNKERAGGPSNPLLEDGGIANSASIQLQPGTFHLARAQALLKVSPCRTTFPPVFFLLLLERRKEKGEESCDPTGIPPFLIVLLAF